MQGCGTNYIIRSDLRNTPKDSLAYILMDYGSSGCYLYSTDSIDGAYSVRLLESTNDTVSLFIYGDGSVVAILVGQQEINYLAYHDSITSSVEVFTGYGPTGSINKKLQTLAERKLSKRRTKSLVAENEGVYSYDALRDEFDMIGSYYIPLTKFGFHFSASLTYAFPPQYYDGAFTFYKKEWMEILRAPKLKTGVGYTMGIGYRNLNDYSNTWDFAVELRYSLSTPSGNVGETQVKYSCSSYDFVYKNYFRTSDYIQLFYMVGFRGEYYDLEDMIGNETEFSARRIPIRSEFNHLLLSLGSAYRINRHVGAELMYTYGVPIYSAHLYRLSDFSTSAIDDNTASSAFSLGLVYTW
jgi:hypothetical protein